MFNLKFNKFNEKEPFYFDYKHVSNEQDEIIMEQHFHNFYEIYLIESGACEYFIDNKVYKVERGDIVLIPEGVIHNTKYKNGNYSRMLINCSYKYIPSQFNLYPKSDYIYRNSKVWDEIYNIFKKIMKEYHDKNSFAEEILESYAQILFLLILRNKNNYTNNCTNNQLIGDAIKYIQENYSNDLTLKEISTQFCVSSEHFSREFKKVTSFGFSKYLNLLRLKKAQGLLKNSEKTKISDIAHQCGFYDSNYFSIKFKEMYGISPKASQLSYKK